MVFMRMMGFPPERFDDFRALADQFFNARDPQQIGTVSQMIIAELMGLIEVKRAAAEAGGEKADLFSQLLDAKNKGAPIQNDKPIGKAVGREREGQDGEKYGGAEIIKK